MIALLFKLIFGLLGTILGLIWYMIKIWFAMTIGLVIFILGSILIF